MPLPLGNVGEYSVPQMSSPVGFSESTGQNSIGLTEHNYLGLPDTSSEESSVVTSGLHDKESSLNLKATELRLGLPGSQSPVRDAELSVSRNPKLDEKNHFPKISLKEAVDEENSINSLFTNLQKTIVSGNKRGYADAMDGFADGKFLNNAGVIAASATSAVGAAKQGSAIWHQNGSEHVGSAMLSSRPSPNHVAKNLNSKEQGGSSSAMMKEIASGKISHERAHAPNNGAAPAAKAQVVGWPPIRSYRKNVLAANMKTSEEVDGKPGSGPLFVKVSMDGAPYLRKVDLKACSTYGELSSALEKMFSCFTIGQCGSHGVPGRDMLSESKLVDLLHGSEYVLTYEDKDTDWMLVGDVPWEMFIDSCRRLRIMKGSDAIGLAPRAMEKCRNRN